MTRRYYVPELPLAGGSVSLPDSEALHAARVMRVQQGQTITLFDGKGNEAEAEVTAVAKRECHCQAHAAVAVNRESSHPVHLAIALPKPDRARELVERLTELGVATITPLVAQRTQRPPTDSLIEKLGRAVVEACKQCGRNQRMKILPTTAAQPFFEQPATSAVRRWIAHQDGPPLRTLTTTITGGVLAAVGPEGGWSEQELELAATHGFTQVGLGKRIYRVETAATVIASMLAD